MEPVENFTVDEGFDTYGTRKQVTFEGDQAVTKYTYDAAPFIEAAHNKRIHTAGDRWSEGVGTHVGFIPMAELGIINRTYKTVEERQAAMLQWLKARPAMVTFDKFLK